MIASAHHAAAQSGWTVFWTFAATYWWVLIFCGGAILEWIGEVCGVGISALARAAEVRHQRKLELARVKADERTQARTVTRLVPAPGPCRHRPRNVKPVYGTDQEHKAWLCTACDTQLPKSWAVLEEDL
jgi:hypothetical protein